jgi:hypothetical protein
LTMKLAPESVWNTEAKVGSLTISRVRPPMRAAHLHIKIRITGHTHGACAAIKNTAACSLDWCTPHQTRRGSGARPVSFPEIYC